MLFRKYGWRAIEIFNRAWINIVKGGIVDITRSSSFDEKIYKVIAKLKTGEFFAVAAVMGAISAENRIRGTSISLWIISRPNIPNSR